ncbi:MAG: response regulator [Desulfobacterales bacterium]|nr:response regulator [Desulfobacterales bacterium]
MDIKPNYRVLIVDDHELNRDKIKYILEDIRQFKLEVITAETGPEALELLKNEQFYMIFLDLNLGKVSGEDVLKQIRRFNKHIKVVILTAADKEDLSSYVKKESIGYIHKSVKKQPFQEIVIQLINKPE